MKKLSIFILVLSLMLISASALADSHMSKMEQGTWTLGIDYDMGGNITEDGTPDSDVNGALTLNGEYIIPYKNNMSYGGGFAYQLSRSLENNKDKEINFMPFYGIFKYDMKNEAYAIGHLGYNVFSGNDAYKNNEELSGGLYYGVGLGVDMREKYNGEFIYSVNNGTRGNNDVKYSKYSLSFGYEF